MAGRSDEIVLYHAPPSFYSQIARLALAEKQVSHRAEVVIPGPPTFETYRPSYMKLNPGGTVPTMTIGDHVYPDSREILRVVGGMAEGPRLVPEDPDERARMERWIDQGYVVQERDLTYSTGLARVVGARLNMLRRWNLLRNVRRHPDLAEVYRAKAADIDKFMHDTADAAHIARLHAKVRGMLDELDAILGSSSWIAGSTYSLADVVWTVTIARHTMNGLAPLDGRANLARWYDDVRSRPSFGTVWEEFRPHEIAAVILSRREGKLIALGLLLAVSSVVGLGVWLL